MVGLSIMLRISQLYIVLLSAFLLTACLDDDSEGASSLRFHPLVTENFKAVSVSGIASKGLISNADIHILSVDESGRSSDLLGVGRTDQAGHYLIDIPAAYVGPVVVRVQSLQPASGLSRMVCDNVGGCSDADGSIQFGELLKLSDNFKMHAASYAPGGGESFEVSVTPLTHMGAALAEGFSEGYSLRSIRESNSQVANLFGIFGDLVRLEPIDLTRSELLVDLDKNLLNYSLFSASFAGLVSNNRELGDMLSSLAEDFVQNGGQLKLSGGSMFSISYDDILDSASMLADHLAQNESLAAEAYARLQRKLVEARSSGSHSFTISAPSETLNLDMEERAKSFVNDLMDWQGVLTLNERDGVGYNDEVLKIKSIIETAEMPAAFFSAAKYTPVLAVVPLVTSNEQLMGLVCSFLGGPMESICRQLVMNTDLNNLDCSGLNGRNPVCKMFDNYLSVNLPTFDDGLEASYSLLGGVLEVSGESHEQIVDLTFSSSGLDMKGENIALAEGSIVNDFSQFYLSAKVGVKGIEDGLPGKSVALASAIVDEDDSQYSISIRYGENGIVESGFQAQSNSGVVADISVISSFSEWGEHNRAAMISYADKQLLIDHNDSMFTLQNQNGLLMEVDVRNDLDGIIGGIYFEQELLASIERINGYALVLFSGGEMVNVSNLIP